MPMFRRPTAILALRLAWLPSLIQAQTTFPPPDTTGWSPAQHELFRFEQARSAAINAHDTVTLRRMYADEFQGVTATGYQVDRARLLSVFGSERSGGRFIIDRFRVRILGRAGDSAVSTARLITLRPDGQPAGRSRFIHVYELRNGRWQIVMAQGTPVGPD